MAEPTRTANRPWKTAVLAGMASYLDSGALVTAGIAIGGSYAGALGLDAGTIGALLGLQTLTFAFGALVGGRLGDRYGRRRVFNYSLLLYAVGVAMLAAATGPGLLYVGVVAVGLAIGADLPVSLALINEEAPPGEKGKMVTFSGLLWLAGIVAVLVASSIVGSWGALGGRIMFAHLFIVAVVVLILRATLRESAEWAAARQAVDTGAADAGAELGAETIHFSRVGQLFRPPIVFAVVALGLYYATWNIGASTLGSFGTFLWTNLTGGDVAQFSQLLLLGFPIGFLSNGATTAVADNHSFDIVSEINTAEMHNAVVQAQHEIAVRYDFKGTHAAIDYNKKDQTLTLLADNKGQLDTVVQMLKENGPEYPIQFVNFT